MRRCLSLPLVGLVLLACTGLALGQDREPPAPKSDAAGKPLLVLDVRGHTAPVRKVLFTHDDKQVITISQDKTIRFWDVQTGRSLRVLRPPAGDGEAGALFAGAISPDGKTLAVAGWGTQNAGKREVGVRLINLADDSLRTFAGHTGPITVLAFSPDGKRLASGSDDRTVRIWNVATGECVSTCKGHGGGRGPEGKGTDSEGPPERGGRIEGPLGPGPAARSVAINDLAFSPNGDRLVTVSGDRSGRIWSVETGKEEALFNERGIVMEHVAWAPDGHLVLTDRFISAGGGPKVVCQWGRDGTPFRRRPMINGDPPINSLIGFPTGGTGREVAYHWVAKDKSGFGVSFLDLKSANARQALVVRDAGAPLTLCTAFSSDGKLGATSGGDDHQTYLWKTEDGTIVARLAGRARPAFRVGWGKSDKSTVAWGVGRSPDEPRPPLSRTFDFSELGLGPVTAPDSFEGTVHKVPPASIGHQRNSNYVLTVHYLKGGKTFAFIHVPFNNNDSYTLLPGRKNKVLVASGASLVLFDVQSAIRSKKQPIFKPGSEESRLFVPHAGTIWAIAPSPDGRSVASVSADQTLRITKVEDGKPLLTLFVLGNEWIAWAPEGYYAASPGGERLMGWLVNNGPDRLGSFYPASQFRASLYRPDVIKRLLTEGSVAKTLAAADKELGREKSVVVEVDEVLPPLVTLTAPKLAGPKTASPTIELTAQAQGRGTHPVLSMQLLLNGRPYEGGLRKVTARPGETVTQSWKIELPPGEHTLRVLARSDASMGLSNDVDVKFSVPPPKPKLFVLAIGINDYPRGVPPLRCAVNDATELEKTFRGRSSELFAIESRVLTDARATKKGILDEGLVWLKSNMTSHDVAVIFYAGHGERDAKGNFFLLPQDVDSTNLAATGISGETLKQHLAGVRGKVLLLLDACHSGAIGRELLDLARNLADEDCGVVVMCAALGKEKAGEADGHGFFCRATIEALEGKGQKNARDGCVYQHHLEQYVNDRVEELSKREQHPTTAKPILPPFPLAKP